jgi:hypothetical protein
MLKEAYIKLLTPLEKGVASKDSKYIVGRIADPDDPYVFGPPGSRARSKSQRYGSDWDPDLLLSLLSSKNSKKNFDSYFL